MISLFNVFNCVRNLQDLSEIMKEVKKLINKKSIFVFELWNKDAVEKDPPKIITRLYKNNDINDSDRVSKLIKTLINNNTKVYYFNKNNYTTFISLEKNLESYEGIFVKILK